MNHFDFKITNATLKKWEGEREFQHWSNMNLGHAVSLEEVPRFDLHYLLPQHWCNHNLRHAMKGALLKELIHHHLYLLTFGLGHDGKLSVTENYKCKCKWTCLLSQYYREFIIRLYRNTMSIGAHSFMVPSPLRRLWHIFGSQSESVQFSFCSSTIGAH